MQRSAFWLAMSAKGGHVSQNSWWNTTWDWWSYARNPRSWKTSSWNWWEHRGNPREFPVDQGTQGTIPYPQGGHPACGVRRCRAYGTDLHETRQWREKGRIARLLIREANLTCKVPSSTLERERTLRDARLPDRQPCRSGSNASPARPSGLLGLRRRCIPLRSLLPTRILLDFLVLSRLQATSHRRRVLPAAALPSPGLGNPLATSGGMGTLWGCSSRNPCNRRDDGTCRTHCAISRGERAGKPGTRSSPHTLRVLPTQADGPLEPKHAPGSQPDAPLPWAPRSSPSSRSHRLLRRAPSPSLYPGLYHNAKGAPPPP